MIKVTCAIIFKQNKLLITQLDENSDHSYYWEFPGGKIENGESEEECIIREIQEELNIQIEIRKIMFPVHHNYGFKEIELIPFLCEIKSGNIELKDHADYKWIELQDLKDVEFIDADKKLIQHKGNQQILEEYFWKYMYKP